ncbi:uncharacterized protein LOC114725403 isoform X1 [Neltuma alba]|uniref:uncharacterized protein LOC114725403 isoform X1 n=1 Tax=Neltuma alba TaxID=207710 RepID=UPI0010A2B1E4|nr:uncharacterized protein LOC114725403 isoform X1 [Prosopis alba]
MSSIGQSILMALTVTVNKYASSNLQAVSHRKHPKSPPNSAVTTSRRGLLLSSLAAASLTDQVPDSRTLLLKKYLKKSEENRDKNDKERLESYYKRNYKDYFELVEGTLKAKQQDQLSDTEKGILDWLKSNNEKTPFFILPLLHYFGNCTLLLFTHLVM